MSCRGRELFLDIAKLAVLFGGIKVVAVRKIPRERKIFDVVSLVSTKKSYELFEIIEIQFVILDLGANGFQITLAVIIRPLCIKTLSFSPN